MKERNRRWDSQPPKKRLLTILKVRTPDGPENGDYLEEGGDLKIKRDNKPKSGARQTSRGTRNLKKDAKAVNQVENSSQEKHSRQEGGGKTAATEE